MSLERLKSLRQTVAEVTEITNKAMSKETMEELAEIRYKSICKIQDCLRDIAEVLKGLRVHIKCEGVNIYWLNQDKDIKHNHNLEVIFDNGVVNLYESSLGSSIKHEDFCSLKRGGIFNSYNGKIETDFLYLLKYWDRIKEIIDVETEKAMLKMIEKKNKDFENFTKNYEVALQFKVD